MSWRKITLVALFVTFGVAVNPIAQNRARAAIAETAATGAVLGQLKQTADDIISKARDAGDFLLWRFGIQLKDLLDAWEKTNSALLDKIFNKIDKEKQDALRGINATIDKTLIEKNLTVEQIRSISAEWAQIISTTIVASSKPYVMHYSPRVLLPEGENIIRIQVVGPNLGRAEAQLTVPSNRIAKPINPTSHNLRFPITRSYLSFPETESTTAAFTLSYLSNPGGLLSFGSRSTNEIEFWLLPAQLGRYEINTRVTVDNRETTTRIVNLGQFKGRNSRIPRAVPVPDAALGWKLDLTQRRSIRLIQGGADRGRCEGIHETSITENGLTMFARVDNRDRGPFRRDAWTNCSISLPLYRVTSSEIDGPGSTGTLNWTKDQSFRLPAQMKSTMITVDLFDKRRIIATGQASDKYLDIRAEGGLIIFRPRPPTDL